MRDLLKLTLVGAVFIPILLFPVLVQAHTCVSYARMPDDQYREILDKYRAIFRGEVVSVDPPSGATQVIHVAITHRWLGTASGTVPVIYHGAYGSFEKEIGGIGTEKIFYAGWDGGMLTAYFCAFEAQSVEDVQRMESILGTGIPIERPSSPGRVYQTDSVTSGSGWLVCACIPILIAIGTALWVLRSLRNRG